MNIVFAGTPAFALPALDALVASSHNVVAVYTQADARAGRGRRLVPSAVKQQALLHKLRVLQPSSLRTEQAATQLHSLQPDLMVVVAYGQLLPATLLTIPRYGCINIHASLLPRWRGAAPIARAIVAGDQQTGVSIMQMNAGLDEGDILATSSYPITDTTTSASASADLAILGAELLTSTLAQLGTIIPQKQDASQACYAHKLTKSEAVIDWHRSAVAIDRFIRGLNPVPVAFTTIGEQRLRIWQARPVTTSNDLSGGEQTPGTIVACSSQGIDVTTGDGVLRIKVAQLPGRRQCTSAALLNAQNCALQLGVVLGC